MRHLFLTTIICFISFHVLADAKMEILTDKVDRMEAELSLIQRKLYQNPTLSSQAPSNIDELYSQLDAQNQVIQDLTQKVEHLEYEFTLLKNRIDTINADVDFRLGELSALKSVEAAPMPVNTLDTKAYEAAYTLLKKGDYEAAEQAFLKFMSDYPSSSYLGNANYWLGESYYARGQYEEATGLFADGFTKYKDNVKAADSMFKLGLTMKALNKKAEACSAFNGLADEFPKANEALKTRAKTEAKALKCP